MKVLLLVALGGGLGSSARYLVGKASVFLWGPDFPWGTLIVNVAGSFLIGVLAGLFAHFSAWSDDARHFAVVGVLGGFTTFSAFSLDLFTLYERGAYGAAAAYLGASVVVSVAALIGGLFLVRSIAA